jgi:hypothetical protein
LRSLAGSSQTNFDAAAGANLSALVEGKNTLAMIAAVHSTRNLAAAKGLKSD